MLLSQQKRKTEQVEMAEEACLCLFTYEELFVIKLSNLKKQEDDVKDWTCLLPPPKIEFSLQLPEPDLCPFEFDSKIYMAVSSSPPLNLGRKPGCWRIYEFKFEERRIELAESLDGVPAPLFRSSIANTPGSGDVYFYINPLVIDSGFYVLCPDSRVWKQLNPPPDYCQCPRDTYFAMFVLHNTVFLSSFTGRGTDSYLAHFDPIKETWTVEPDSDNNLSKFINARYNHGLETGSCRATYPPQISVPLLGLGSNYTVCLAHDKYVDGPPLNTPLEKVFAILVNHQNGRVALYQYLDVFFEGFQPWMTDRARVNLVDLGNGKVCAILSDELLDSGSESLAFCFSVFTLSLLEDFAALQLDSGAPPMERDFLKVTVHRKCVYIMKNWNPSNYMRHVFVWPPTKGRRFYHSTG
ncbi:hypothetical protein HN51_003079 [Arachis hypogaea]|uniref:uncharacterized protein n=1 Tax=Arachis hypogaea TaxID=3818 RepID=UPI000DEC1E94|nr:uncharacterized protein LOC112708308 [Arachis hypogaea]QHO51395.1 uncharacterized protein DS421_1g30550 [Arachis hypogaea]